MGDVGGVGGVGSVSQNFGVGGMIGLGQKTVWVNVLLFNHTVHYLFYRTLYNCTK